MCYKNICCGQVQRGAAGQGGAGERGAGQDVPRAAAPRQLLGQNQGDHLPFTFVSMNEYGGRYDSCYTENALFHDNGKSVIWKQNRSCRVLENAQREIKCYTF